MPHIHEKIDFTVEVFVVYKNKVLLRLHDKYNLWLSVGGHIELDEDSNQAAVREVFEEVALKIKLYDGLEPKIKEINNYQELIPPFFLNRHRINEKHEHVTMTYFATSETDIIVQEEDEKSKECRWMSKDEIEKLEGISPSIKYYALKALEILSK